MHIPAKNRTEVSMKDLSEDEIDQVTKGMEKEWSKLLKTESGALRSSEQPFQMSRFWNRARRECPDKPGVMELNWRWCVKVFKDPEVHVVENSHQRWQPIPWQWCCR